MNKPVPNLFSWEHDPTIDRPRTETSANGTAANAWQSAWDLKRDPARPNDLKLSPLAVKWLADLPDALKPVALADRFPRIANRLALSWKDAELACLLLAELQQDRRGGRKGFPQDVREELLRLAVDAKKRKSGL